MTRRLLAPITTLVFVSLVGCGSSQTPAEEPSFMPTKPSTVTESTPTTAEPSSEGKLTEDQEEQMIIALKRGAEKAAQCVDVVPDSPRGEGEVQITFDGKKGRVTDAVPGAPFAGSSVEACIRRAFVGEIILPFDGEPKVVSYGVKLPEKGAKKEPKK